jgi:hypothetical protein
MLMMEGSYKVPTWGGLHTEFYFSFSLGVYNTDIGSSVPSSVATEKIVFLRTEQRSIAVTLQTAVELRDVYGPSILNCLEGEREPGSSVSIVSDYGLDDQTIEVRSPAEAKDFSSKLCVQTGSGAHQWVTWVLSPG